MKKTNEMSAKKKEELIKRKISHKDLIAYRFAISMILAIVGIILVNYVANNPMVYITLLNQLLFPLTALFAVLSVATLALLVKNKNGGSTRLVTTASLFAYSLTALYIVASYYLTGIEYTAVRIVPLVVLPILYYIYNTFNSVFFTVSLQCAIGFLALNLLSTPGIAGIKAYVVAALAIVMGVAAGFAALRIFSKIKNDGNSKKTGFYIMSAIILAGVLLSVLVPGIVTYAMFTLIAAYLVIAVISTIEMM